jgi:hypothetical protein
MVTKKIWKTCGRGHRYQKSSDCPICPICWSGYYRTKSQSDFPEHLSAPALRALLHAKITTLSQLTKYTEKEIANLHGMGPKGVKMLKSSLMAMKKAFKTALATSNGSTIVKHRDGSPWAAGKTVAGKPDGFWKWFRLDGSVMRSGTFKKGVQIGEWTTYDRSGRVVKVTQIKPKK